MIKRGCRGHDLPLTSFLSGWKKNEYRNEKSFGRTAGKPIAFTVCDSKYHFNAGWFSL